MQNTNLVLVRSFCRSASKPQRGSLRRDIGAIPADDADVSQGHVSAQAVELELEDGQCSVFVVSMLAASARPATCTLGHTKARNRMGPRS